MIERPSPTHPFRVTFASSDHEGDDVPETSSVAGDGEQLYLCFCCRNCWVTDATVTHCVETQTTRFFDSQLQGGSLVFNTQDGLDIPYRPDGSFVIIIPSFAGEIDPRLHLQNTPTKTTTRMNTQPSSSQVSRARSNVPNPILALTQSASGMHGTRTAQAHSSHLSAPAPAKSQGGADLRPESSPQLRWLTPLDSDDEDDDDDNNNENNNEADEEAESHANSEADVASNAQLEHEEPEPEPWEEEAEADELISYDEEEEADELADADPNENPSNSAPAVQSTQAAIYDPDADEVEDDNAADYPADAEADGDGDLDYDEVEDGELDADAADVVEEPEPVASAVLTPRPDVHASTRPSESSKSSPLRTWSSHSSKRSFVEDDDEVENVEAHGEFMFADHPRDGYPSSLLSFSFPFSHQSTQNERRSTKYYSCPPTDRFSFRIRTECLNSSVVLLTLPSSTL